MSRKKQRCQCPECHCVDEYEEPEKVDIIPPNASPAWVSSLKDIRYLESKTHLNLCPRCSSGQHNIL